MTDQIHNEMVFNGQAQIVPINNGYSYEWKYRFKMENLFKRNDH